MNAPRSCDTFAALPPGTRDGCIVFGKNSDRPGEEVQEVVYFPSADHSLPSKVKCTYIEIEQVGHTHAVILSKPSWIWGAEMGANEHNVCIGNEAVWTKLNDRNEDLKEKLLGMDLLRLALERAATALEAVHVIVALIEEYGMGGECSDILTLFTYHNSFLIADPSEVWVLECAGKMWAAEKVTEGVRNMSNELTITTKVDLKCNNLEDFAREKEFWDFRRGPLNFKVAYGLDEEGYESHRYKAGKRLLTNLSENGQFSAEDMFKVLRDKPSGICMSSGSFVSTGSQVSVLRKPETGKPSCHWFTATPDPARSIYKPFFFTEQVAFPHQVVSPECKEPNAPQSSRKYELYKSHENVLTMIKMNKNNLRNKMKEMESSYISQSETLASNFESMKDDASQIFKKAVEEELSLYA